MLTYNTGGTVCTNTTCPSKRKLLELLLIHHLMYNHTLKISKDILMKKNIKETDIRSNSKTKNKGNLDSREGEEQLTKGDDTTHNKKEKQSAGKT